MARASAVLGDRWTLLLLSDIFLGARRFEDFQERLGISRTTLANRLKLLEEHAVITRVPYQDNPPRNEYRLTDKGLDLFPVISTVINWGDKYYAGEHGPPILRRHTSCGEDVQPVLCCPQCHEEIGVLRVEGSRYLDLVPKRLEHLRPAVRRADVPGDRTLDDRRYDQYPH